MRRTLRFLLCGLLPCFGGMCLFGQAWKLRFDAQAIGAMRTLAVRDTSVNPGNILLGLPSASWLGELRGNARVEIGSRVQAVLRPRIHGWVNRVRTSSLPADYSSEAQWEMTEAYANWSPADSLSVAYGLQNFQWGPAELMAPSNRLFHEKGVFRDALYTVRGKQLLRINVSAGRQWNLVGLAELGDNGEDPFRAGALFRRAVQGKLEYTGRSGDSYVGLTAGARGGEPMWMGAYGSRSLTQGLSAYLDASWQKGSQAWYPAPLPGGAVGFEQNSRQEGLRGLILGGLRYSFVSGLDARLEFLHQGSGYSASQIALAPRAMQPPQSPAAVEQWLSPGLEFLGRNLIYVSVFKKDLPPSQTLALAGRYVHSRTDGSGAGFLTASLDAGKSLVFFASFLLTHGGESAEFSRLSRIGGDAGFIWSW